MGFTADQVINWAYDDAGRLARIMVEDVRDEWAGPESGNVKVYRWRYIDNTTIQIWEWRSTAERRSPMGSDVASEAATIQHQIGRMPVVELCLPPGLWAMGKLEDPALRHMRAVNEQDWALHQSAHALLVIRSKWGDEQVNLGHGHFLKLGETDNAEFISPDASAFDHLGKRVAEAREDLFRVVSQMALAADSDATRARMSGESKAQDWKATDIVLAALSGLVLDAMAEVLEVVTVARGGKAAAAPTVSGLDGWQSMDTEQLLLLGAMAVDARSMSATFRKALAKAEARRVLGSEISQEELAQVEKEIDEAPRRDGPVHTASGVGHG